MLNNNTDDDDFFPTSTVNSSNLANLFGINSPAINSQVANEPSLKYTAPKQPKTDTDKAKPQNKLIIAKTVQVHKLIDENYVNIGIYGLAIIGDDSLNVYNLIVYKTRQNILSTSKLTEKFTYTRDKSKWGSFMDDQGNNFKVEFDDLKNFTEFSLEMEKKGIKVVLMDEEAKKIESKFNVRDETDNTQARALILNRISKVGQSMLPNNGKNLSGSESDEGVMIKKTRRKSKPRETEEANFVVPMGVSQPQYYHPYVPNTMLPNTMLPNAMIQNTMLPPSLQMMDPMSVFFAENRTHNSEVRMNLSQLSSKLEVLLKEIGRIDVASSGHKQMGTDTPNLSFIEEKIAALEFKIHHLESTPRLNTKKENSNQTETPTKDLTRENEVLTEEIKCLKSKLQKQSNDIQNLTLEQDKLINTIDELKLKLVKAEENVTESRDIILKQSNKISELDQNLNTSALKNVELNNAKENAEESSKLILKYTNKISELERDLITLKLENADERERQCKLFTESLKNNMNEMFQSVMMRCVDEDGVLTTMDLQTILTLIMKTITFQIINDYKRVVQGDMREEVTPPPVPEFEVTV